MSFAAPMLGGELAQSVGFPNLMRFMGILNLMYSPLLFYLMRGYDAEGDDEENLPIQVKILYYINVSI